MKVRAIIGPPGTGKTTTLARTIRESGQTSSMVCSYTNAAAQEAASRDTGLSMDQIGTMHKHAYGALGAFRDNGRPALVDHREFNDRHPAFRLSMSVHSYPILPRADACEENDWLHSEYELSRQKMVHRSLWSPMLSAFAQDYERFKTDTGTIDFTDMLELCLTEAKWLPWEPQHIYIDEAQDMTRLQLQVARQWAAHPTCGELVLVGDPDQAIYEHLGAYPQLFYRPEIQDRVVLEQSYRVPRAVHALATKWRRQLPEQEFAYLPRDAEGQVVESPAGLSEPARVMELIKDELERTDGTVMLMTSCKYMLNKPFRRGWTGLIRMLEEEGIPFWNPWRKKEAYWNPERLDGEPDPRLAVGNIHSFKGAEADTVIFFPDLSPKFARQLDGDSPGGVIRMVYVALTRARHRLILLDPSGPDHVEINISK